MLAARCSRIGWDVGENTISKIEAQVRCVTDEELVHLASALKVKEQDLFPPARKSWESAFPFWVARHSFSRLGSTPTLAQFKLFFAFIVFWQSIVK
jgi:hypothetical protein